MLSNATLIRIDLPGTPDVSGAVAFVTGAAIAVDVMVDMINRGQMLALQGRVTADNRVVYAPMDDISREPQPRDRWAFVMNEQAGGDGTTVLVREVILAKPDFKTGGLSSWAVFVREVA